MARSADGMSLDEVLAAASGVVDRVASIEAERVDRDGVWPQKTLQSLLAAGLGGLVVPRKWGGLGHGMLAVARVCEMIASHCASSALCFGMHLVGSAVLAAKATSHHGDAYLAPIASGEHITTLALSEPATGSHFWIPETVALEEDDGYVIRGTKSFVTSGGHADSYVLSVATPQPPGEPGIFSCVVVPKGAQGLEWGPPWDGLGMRGNASRNLELRDVRVGRDHLLGEEGDELWYMFEVIAPYFLTAMAGTYLGISTAALKEVRAHVAGRRHAHTGQALAANHILQHRLGTLFAVVERSRALLYRAASLAESGSAEALGAVLSAKAECDDSAVTVANEAMTLGGGIAYRENARLARHLRDARAAKVMSPTTDLLRIWTGRMLLDRPLLQD